MYGLTMGFGNSDTPVFTPDTRPPEKTLEHNVFSKLNEIAKATAPANPSNSNGPFSNIQSVSVEDAIRELIELEKIANQQNQS